MIKPITVTLVALSLSVQVSEPSSADLTWLDEHLEASLDAFMPVKLPPSPQVGPLVSYRRYRDLYHDVEERYFKIDYAERPHFDPKRFSATVVVPIGQSIQQQLLDARMKDRASSFESLLSRVRIRTNEISSGSCPAVSQRMEALRRLTFSAVDRENAIILHPVVHRVTLDFLNNNFDATLYDPENRLVRWATQTMDALLACEPR